jgi:hypothetical protein
VGLVEDNGRTMRSRSRLQGWLLAATLSLVTTTAFAQVYKWVDEKGVTNYSNEAPAKSGRNVTVVEDRISVYTPEQSVLDAAQKARERSAAPPPAPTQPAVTVIAPSAVSAPPAVMVGNDACRNTTDPNCYGAPLFGVPVIIAPRRAPQLNQPQLTPGAIAGNVTGSSGYIPGLSGQTPPPAALTPTRRSAASFTVRPRPDEYRGDRGR